MMTSRPMRALQQLDTRLQEQILDVAHLRVALDAQMNRISQMYDHGGHAASIRRRCDRDGGTRIRGRSTVNTHRAPSA
jgi:hypothetical protein